LTQTHTYHIYKDTHTGNASSAIVTVNAAAGWRAWALTQTHTYTKTPTPTHTHTRTGNAPTASVTVSAAVGWRAWALTQTHTYTNHTHTHRKRSNRKRNRERCRRMAGMGLDSKGQTLHAWHDPLVTHAPSAHLVRYDACVCLCCLSLTDSHAHASGGQQAVGTTAAAFIGDDRLPARLLPFGCRHDY